MSQLPSDSDHDHDHADQHDHDHDHDQIRFDDHVVIVTGAGAGLGREHALLLASRGATVVVNDVSASRAQRTLDDIVAAGGTAKAVVSSVSDPGEAASLINDAYSVFGRLDAVLNNAGAGGPTGPIDTVDDAVLHQIVDSHLLGSFYTARAAWPIMRGNGGGRIVFTTSGSAMGAAGMPVYSMAKAGLWGLTRTLAIEGAPDNIIVNAILPMGYTRGASLNPNEDTRQWMETNLPPSLSSPAAVLLCHPLAPCTGELISSAGGRVARIATVGVPGFDDGAHLTIERLRDHWNDVMSMDGSQVLRMSRDELAFFQGAAKF
jgi:NAD(P)-dependent dehydrogenase (short-subunit alcohol dehydrogenase family)